MTPEPLSSSSSRGDPSPRTPLGKLIPLFPGISRGTEDRRAALRAAVIQVVGHLVERAVPPAQRVPLFDQAIDLLDEAGWGLDELRGSRQSRPRPRRAASGPGIVLRPSCTS